jgi:hypothetical protein
MATAEDSSSSSPTEWRTRFTAVPPHTPYAYHLRTRHVTTTRPSPRAPVTAVPLGATPWLLVRTNDGLVFFHHRPTHRSLWSLPAATAPLPSKDAGDNDDDGEQQQQLIHALAALRLLIDPSDASASNPGEGDAHDDHHDDEDGVDDHMDRDDNDDDDDDHDDDHDDHGRGEEAAAAAAAAAASERTVRAEEHATKRVRPAVEATPAKEYVEFSTSVSSSPSSDALRVHKSGFMLATR